MARREHSKLELTRKLVKAGYSDSEVHEAMDWLDNHQLQSDDRFVQSLSRRRAHNYGDRAISAELAQHGLKPIDPKDSDHFELSSELQRIHLWLDRRYVNQLEAIHLEDGSLDRDPLFKLKVKAYRALSARGFAQSNIESAWKRFIDEFISDRC